MNIMDEGTHIFAEVSNSIKEERLHGEHWEGSPFEWMLSLPSGTKGAVGRQLLRIWAETVGLEARLNGMRLEVLGISIAVKMSTLWQGNEFKFQQIRDEAYDQLLFLGIAPGDVYAWMVPKNVVLEELRGRSGQHTGKGAKETLWETVSLGHSPRWLRPYGDRLSDVRDLIVDLAY